MLTRRGILCSLTPFAVGAGLLIAGSESIAAHVDATKPKELIKVNWYKDPKFTDYIVTYVSCVLWVDGIPVYFGNTAWRTGSEEGRELALSMMTDRMKRILHVRLQTTEYDPVIENSITEFYYDNH